MIGEFLGTMFSVVFWAVFGPLVAIGGLGLMVFVWRAIVGSKDK